jgi:transcriptional regulator with XRE-family HTH domain
VGFGLNEDWQAVADAINARMTELPLTQRELAERSGVSVATLREVQHAKAARRRSTHLLSAISTALGWPEDQLRLVLAGEIHLDEGTAAGTGTGRGGMATVLQRLDDLHGEVRRLADAVERLADDGRSG